MQSDGQINDSPAIMGNGNVFHGCRKRQQLNGTKHPFVVLSAACEPTFAATVSHLSCGSP